MLPFAIQRGVTVRVSPRDDGMLTASSEQMAGSPVKRALSSLSPHAASWAAYAEGAAWVLGREGVDLPGADVHINGDLPAGAGLSSSAAMTCGVLAALLALSGRTWDPQRVALAARRVENDYLGVPVGVMDPMVVMHATEGHALLVDTRTLTMDQVPLGLDEAGMSVLVVDTGTSHRTAGGDYTERVAQCRDAARALGVDSLRDVTDPRDVADLADPVLRARARHVVTENARVLAAVTCLRAGHLEDLGPLMVASHESLRDDFAVSTQALDRAVAAAVGAGAAGARMTGAGFGGCAVALLSTDRILAVETAVTEALAGAARHGSPQMFEVRPSAGAHPLPADQA